MNGAKTIDVYTDGACKGNPGPGGWGFVLKHKTHVKKRNGFSSLTTNNIMELTAVIKSIEYFFINGEFSFPLPIVLNITTDSKYVFSGVKEWLPNWKKRNWKTSNGDDVKNKELWVRLDELLSNQNITVNMFWVKGHSGHEYNELADQLANEAIAKWNS
jgi:ribonuclease HI